MVSINNNNPTITWTYDDPNLQPQQAFRVIVTRDPSKNEEILWDTGEVESDQTEIVYGYNGNARELPSHETLRLTVMVYDGMSWGTSLIKEFVVSGIPEISICTVDNKVNPTNLTSLLPTFRWKYTDLDSDPLVAYEIRVDTEQTNWGTDGFPGAVWNTGVVQLPNPHESKLGEDGKLFCGCVFPKQLTKGVVYYYQIQVHDAYNKSAWYTGFFRLNNAPTAVDLAVLPVDPNNGDDLEATYTFVDDAGEQESEKTQIRWYRNSKEVLALRNNRIVPGTLTKPDESWYFTVTPHDGVEYGLTYTSPRVAISNQAPKITASGIVPKEPRTSDALEAIFYVSDFDRDSVVVTIGWFKNGIEQPALRNRPVVPPGYGTVGDQFYFQVQASDGFAMSKIEKSEPVTIQNTVPSLRYLFVQNAPLPSDIQSQSPSVWWKYNDPDGQEQQSYQVMIGTTPPIPTSSADASYASSSSKISGIVAVASELRDGTGDDILNTGVVNSKYPFYTRELVDSREPLNLGAAQSTRYTGYYLDKDLQTTILQPQMSKGEAVFLFQGVTGIYEVQIEFVGEANKKSNYRLLVDGVTIDQFTSEGIAGTRIRSFSQAKIQNGSLVTVVGSPAEKNGRAPFRKLVCNPVLSFENMASQMQLAGYVDAGDGTIRLVGSEGVAQLRFPYTTGKYDIDIYYVTESTGNPESELLVDGTVVYSWTFESGLQKRMRTVSSVDLETGSIVKVSSIKDEDASAKIEKLVFKPSTAGGLAALRPGRRYFVSVRVSDGLAWSDWYITYFTMAGSAWYADVSNDTGWTIEFVARLIGR
jgi:hypothetical protein